MQSSVLLVVVLVQCCCLVMAGPPLLRQLLGNQIGHLTSDSNASNRAFQQGPLSSRLRLNRNLDRTSPEDLFNFSARFGENRRQYHMRLGPTLVDSFMNYSRFLSKFLLTDDIVPFGRQELPLPALPNFSVVVADPFKTPGHYIFGVLPKSEPLPTNLLWVDNIRIPGEAKLVLAMPGSQGFPAKFKCLIVVPKERVLPKGASILNYAFPPLRYSGGFLNPQNAYLLAISYDRVLELPQESRLFLGLIHNANPLTEAIAALPSVQHVQQQAQQPSQNPDPPLDNPAMQPRFLSNATLAAFGKSEEENEVELLPNADQIQSSTKQPMADEQQTPAPLENAKKTRLPINEEEKEPFSFFNLLFSD